MDRRQRLELKRLDAGTRFLDGHKGVLKKVNESAVRAGLDTAITQAVLHAKHQAELNERAGVLTRQLRAMRVEARHHLARMALMGARRPEDTVSISKMKTPDDRASSARLAGELRSMAILVKQHQSKLAEQGLDPDTPDRLAAEGDALEKTLLERNGCRSSRKGARAGLKAELKTAWKEVRHIGALIADLQAPKARKLLGEWRGLMRHSGHLLAEPRRSKALPAPREPKRLTAGAKALKPGPAPQA